MRCIPAAGDEIPEVPTTPLDPPPPTEPELVLDLLAVSPTWALFEQLKAEVDTKIARSFGAVG